MEGDLPPSFRSKRRQIHEELLDLREIAVQKIVRKNRLRIAVERLRDQLDTASLSERTQLEKDIERIEPHLAKAEVEVERIKAEVQVRETEAFLGEYPPEHHERARQLLQDMGKTLRMAHQASSPLKALHQRMIDLMVDISEYRSAGDDARAEALVPALDEVLEQIEAKQTMSAADWAIQRRKLVGHLEDELESLKNKEI